MYLSKTKSLQIMAASVALLLAATHLTLSSDRSSSDGDLSMAIAQWLYICSPFKSFDGYRALYFFPRSHTVTLIEVVSDETRTAVPYPKIVGTGTWIGDEKAKRVSVDLGIGHVRFTYAAVMTSNLDQCILAAGTITSANLRNSWFGGPISIEPQS